MSSSIPETCPSAQSPRLLLDDFPYLLECPLPQLDPQRDRMVELVMGRFATWSPSADSYNFPVDGAPFEALYDLFWGACAAAFGPLSLHPNNSRQAWAYVQDHAKFAEVWHDHLRSATINGVYYLSVPDPSAQLWCQHLERRIELTPEAGVLYLFPRWLAHKPRPQRSATPRVSINIELTTREYPIASHTQVRW